MVAIQQPFKPLFMNRNKNEVSKENRKTIVKEIIKRIENQCNIFIEDGYEEENVYDLIISATETTKEEFFSFTALNSLGKI